jgi:iron(III) transport system ATP-binding protein
MTPAVELDGVRLRLGRSIVLDQLCLAVPHGQLVAVLGPSGSGKTSLLRAILGLVAIDDGVIRIEGHVASDPRRIVIPPDERQVAAVFQDLALWPHLTVHGNLAFGLSRLTRADRDARIVAMLERVGLAAKQRCHPGELSGGERQRVAIARALVLAPRVVALDEPLANLDLVLKRDLLALFGAVLRERGTAAIYVTHDPWEAEILADRIAVVEAGRLVQIGTMTELRTSPASSFVKKLISPREVNHG